MRTIVLVGLTVLALLTATGELRSASAGAAGQGEADQPAKTSVKPATTRRAELDAGRAEVRLDPVEVRREYRISLGRWSTTVTVPENVDLIDLADRVRGFFGMAAILGAACFLSENPRSISRRVFFWGLGLQWVFAILVLRVPAGVLVLRKVADAVEAMLDCAIAGASFVFGPKLVDANGPAGAVFAFRVLPTVVFVAALFAVLYHLGLMERIVRLFAWVMAWLMGTSGAESLDVAASLFLGQTEAPLSIRPYLAGLTRSELLTVMTAGMAHVSGGVMAAYFAYGIEPRHVITAVIMTAPAPF